jgi:hypothetical protein
LVSEGFDDGSVPALMTYSTRRQVITCPGGLVPYSGLMMAEHPITSPLPFCVNQPVTPCDTVLTVNPMELIEAHVPVAP